MNVFNSLGSNYNFLFVVKSFLWGSKSSHLNLIKHISEKYDGKTILTYKGREAIELALQKLKLEDGSGVAITGFTCIAVVEAIERKNLKPIYLDINPKTLNFSAKTLEEKIHKNNIKAVIIQNTLGYPCDIESIQHIYKKYKLILIEDLAHSIGTIYKNGKEAGTVGDFVVFSFSQDKVIDAVSGGALIIRNSKFDNNAKDAKLKKQENTKDKLYPLLTFLVRKTYPFKIGKVLHFLFKIFHLLSDPMKTPKEKTISDWQAELILDGFKNLRQQLEHRRKIAQIYSDSLDKKVLLSKVSDIIPVSTNLRFPIFVNNREKLINMFRKSGVYISDIWYDSPVAPKKYLGLAKYPKETCPEAEKVSEKILNLPTHINISEKDAREISIYINRWLKSNK